MTITRHGNVIVPGVKVHHHLLRPDETCLRRGVWMSNTARTALDCMATLHWREAAGFARDAAFRGWVDRHSLATAIHERVGWSGAPQLVRLQRMLSDGGRCEAELVIAEVDGYAIHSRRETFQRDRTKQNRVAAAGYVVLRFTWEDLAQRPHHVVAKLRAVLDQCRPSQRAQ